MIGRTGSGKRILLFSRDGVRPMLYFPRLYLNGSVVLACAVGHGG
jgi:hypothetical protein